MAYENEQQTQDPVQDEKQRPEEQRVPEGAVFSLPNSIMMAMPVAPPPGTPNSVMREMLDEQNGASGSFSEGSSFGTVNSIRRNRSGVEIGKSGLQMTTQVSGMGVRAVSASPLPFASMVPPAMQ